MDAHAKKMSKINKDMQVIKDAQMVSMQLKRNKEERKRTKDFLMNEKNITINKDN